MQTFRADTFCPLLSRRHRFIMFGIGGTILSIFTFVAFLVFSTPLHYWIPSTISLIGSVTTIHMMNQPRRDARDKLKKFGLDPKEALNAYKVFMSTLVPVKLADGRYLSVSIIEGEVLAHIAENEKDLPELDIKNENFIDGELRANANDELPLRYLEAFGNMPIPFDGLKQFMLYQPDSGFASIVRFIDFENRVMEFKSFRVNENSVGMVPRDSESRGGSVMLMPDESLKFFSRQGLNVTISLLIIFTGMGFFLTYGLSVMDNFIDGRMMIFLGASAVIPLIWHFSNVKGNIFTNNESNIFMRKFKKKSRFQAERWDVIVLRNSNTNEAKVLYTQDQEALNKFFGVPN